MISFGDEHSTGKERNELCRQRMAQRGADLGQYLCKKIASTLGVACRRWMRIVEVEIVNNSQRMMRSLSASRMAREEER